MADLAGGFGGTGAFGDISISILDSQKIYDFYDECTNLGVVFCVDQLVGTVTSFMICDEMSDGKRNSPSLEEVKFGHGFLVLSTIDFRSDNTNANALTQKVEQ